MAIEKKKYYELRKRIREGIEDLLLCAGEEKFIEENFEWYANEHPDEDDYSVLTYYKMMITRDLLKDITDCINIKFE